MGNERLLRNLAATAEAAVRSFAVSLRPCTLAFVALAVALPRLALAQASGLVVTGGLGVGGELGLDEGKAGVVEAEFTVGWEFQPSAIRPELGVVAGFAPDGHFALRPGVRYTFPELPLQLRVAFDASNSRDPFRWRWLLVGIAAELRVSSTFGLFAGVDSGAPLSEGAGVPLLVRAGASFRL